MKPKLRSDVKQVAKVDGVTFYANDDHSYICFIADLSICNDGSGPRHGDPHYQSQTAYYNSGKYLNADRDRYIVVPPQIRKKCKRVVLGCQGRLTNLVANVSSAAVTGEIGPKAEFGEASYSLAKIVNPDIGYNSGDDSMIYFYELWPDVPAVVGDKHYKLEPAG